ncbi:hypothetical protein FACS189472_08780 [Alphaproteobacteria bacterium]|nr:hypothetical protein FACS189472_08780 [Alphaproteobacteria bacterium]
MEARNSKGESIRFLLRKVDFNTSKMSVVKKEYLTVVSKPKVWDTSKGDVPDPDDPFPPDPYYPFTPPDPPTTDPDDPDLSVDPPTPVMPGPPTAPPDVDQIILNSNAVAKCVLPMWFINAPQKYRKIIRVLGATVNQILIDEDGKLTLKEDPVAPGYRVFSNIVSNSPNVMISRRTPSPIKDFASELKRQDATPDEYANIYLKGWAEAKKLKMATTHPSKPVKSAKAPKPARSSKMPNTALKSPAPPPVGPQTLNPAAKFTRWDHIEHYNKNDVEIMIAPILYLIQSDFKQGVSGCVAILLQGINCGRRWRDRSSCTRQMSTTTSLPTNRTISITLSVGKCATGTKNRTKRPSGTSKI